MSMGYDEDDPRRQQVLDNLALGLYKLKPGQQPNNSTAHLRGARRSPNIERRSK